MVFGLLAHSAATPEAQGQPYPDHINAVVFGARKRAEALTLYAGDDELATVVTKAVDDAAYFHDLGKLDDANQAALRKGRKARLPWDHIDAGVAHLMAHCAGTAAWVVRAHHAPGLPKKAAHFSRPGRNPDQVRKLRGRRSDEDSPERHQEQIERTNAKLADMLVVHTAEVGSTQPARGKTRHGLPLRLALSCLVDADHTDSAFADNGWSPPDPPAPRWEERLAALDAYVGRLQSEPGERNTDRADFYKACRDRTPDAAMIACEGPVGIGKTTAVTAYLIRRAIQTKARRLFVVAPYTAILSQTAGTLRKALVLDDERDMADAVVAEHHHRADFSDIASRDLATLWSAPIILTTAVQFFETLASNLPAALRKLHALPGSVIFLDEAHAALPTDLWPQNWLWLKSLAEEWSCSFVFASGSLARFWENPDIADKAVMRLPDIAPTPLAQRLTIAERRRVQYRPLGRLDGPGGIAAAVLGVPGPRLLILNTVQSAAVMARDLRGTGQPVMHISTALCPDHRSLVLERIIKRLDSKEEDWTLVATSLVEAGIDLSFRNAFRESFSTASLIQVGGRVNRHSEEPTPGTVYDFFFDPGPLLNCHPAAVAPRDILHEFFRDGRFSKNFDAAKLVTEAMARELRKIGENAEQNALRKAESENDYPKVADRGRVIDTDTQLVVVDQRLRDRLANRERVDSRDLLGGSVQMWKHIVQKFGVECIAERKDVFWWPHDYESTFLGYMSGVLPILRGDVFTQEA